MKSLVTGIAVLSFAVMAKAQSPQIREGNKLYKEGRYEEAVLQYEEALKKNPDDFTAIYNRSNALAKKGDKAAAMEGYEKIIQKGKDPRLVEKAYYDKGVLHQQQQQLDESISAWMEALKMDPEDKEARENLQKALREKKQQQKKEEEKEKEEKKDKKEEKQQEKKPQQSKLNKKQVEQLLKALEQKEKEVQKKMQQKGGSPSRPEKDW
ncbi:tetratricopeptide repeat protein [Flavihumibacter sp. UBA7668]|uniref:tetratricopeptide repeat protein n=1 Tax=Flavihumibacter sp. UBA7668 TaxID=1946542 RepID=UPI0025B9D3B8|nr:tetratricopeptide repeat protein [Flavihumibacter sp. UBA7668]